MFLDDSYGEPYDVAETGTVAVDGAEAEFVRGTIVNVCDDSGCRDRPFVDLVWERAAGQWIWLQGEGAYGDVVAVVGVAESLVDRPQPINLQVGLAPAGWSVVDWHESSGAISLADDDDPSQVLGVMMPGSSRIRVHDEPVEQRIASVTADRPGGLDRRSTVGPPRSSTPTTTWIPDEPFLAPGVAARRRHLVTVQAPEAFAQDDVLAIAEQVTYNR